uniref:Uncharacterized protein n=1 Tax=Amphimedon queenslandica TaxID=400682 RepID=A0A1X7V6V1_AMPQE
MADEREEEDTTATGAGETGEVLLSPAALRQITDALLTALASRGPHPLSDFTFRNPMSGSHGRRLVGLTVDPSLMVDGSSSLPGLVPSGSWDGVPPASEPARTTTLITERPSASLR